MDISILIPARNEAYLKNTIDDLLSNIEADTEIIVVTDGDWPVESIPDHERVTLIKTGESIGQRAATNMAARVAKGRYLIKTDAHCAFDKGFDRKLLSVIEPDMTLVPTMKNLHVFDWVCNKCNARWYQGPTPTKCQSDNCDSLQFHKDILWRAKPSPNSTSYRFDNTLHFQYFSDYKRHQHGDLVETMSLQGSFFMLSADKYWELNICDENFGSWGQQGVEVACKTWLSGGRVMCYQATWYAHLFRTQGGDFGFPYPQSAKQVEHARKYSRDLFLNNKWDKQVKPLSWLIDKFAPVPGWHDTPSDVYDKVKAEGVKFYENNPLLHG